MNKNWLILTIIGAVTLLSIAGYQVFLTISGDTNDFGKVVSSISSDLGKKSLTAIGILDKNSPVRDEALNNK
jgi:hypothetical protein